MGPPNPLGPPLPIEPYSWDPKPSGTPTPYRTLQLGPQTPWDPHSRDSQPFGTPTPCPPTPSRPLRLVLRPPHPHLRPQSPPKPPSPKSAHLGWVGGGHGLDGEGAPGDGVPIVGDLDLVGSLVAGGPTHHAALGPRPRFHSARHGFVGRPHNSGPHFALAPGAFRLHREFLLLAHLQLCGDAETKGLNGGSQGREGVKRGGPDPHVGIEGGKVEVLTHMVVRKGLKGVPDPYGGEEGVKGGS